MRALTPMQNLAIMYASHGVKVFPCREQTDTQAKVKGPLVHGGFKSATDNLARVVKWWNYWPNALVGMPCRMNGLIVIDPDRHGGYDGVNAFALLARTMRFDMQGFLCVKTPNSGLHLYFQRPHNLGETIGKLGPSIDVKDNGYVIAAGSILGDGRSYELQNWSLDSLADWITEKQLLTLPEWLIDAVSKPVHAPKPYSQGDMAACPENILIRLKALVRKVALAPEGDRNKILFWATCRAGEMIRDGLVLHDTAFELFVEAGLYCGLDRREAERSVRSGLNASAGSV